MMRRLTFALAFGLVSCGGQSAPPSSAPAPRPGAAAVPVPLKLDRPIPYPVFETALFKRAFAARQSGQIPKAKQLFQQIVDNYRKSPEALLAQDALKSMK
jgi:hypothetical protein